MLESQGKRRLLSPGPTEVPQAALAAMGQQVVHHRTPEFRALLGEVLAGLKRVFQTQNDVLLLTSSGTGAMEAAVVNLVPRGGKAIVLCSGKFAERWADIAERYGVVTVRLEIPWGEAFEAADVARLLDDHPDAVAVFSTLQETSTGVGHDIEAIARVVRPSGALMVVDGISGVGAMPCRTDAWGIDVLVVGGQKALMAPPGVAMLAVSPAAWRQVESIDRPAFYFDLLAYRKGLSQGPDTPYTPSVPLVKALAESVRLLDAEGAEATWRRCGRLAEAARAGVRAMGLELVARRPAEGLTAAYLPEGIDGRQVLARLRERFGLTLAGGQGPLAGRIVRIAHFGQIDELDLLGALAALELVLVEHGASVKLGDSAAAASRELQT